MASSFVTLMDQSVFTIANHLWQSTLFACAVALLAVAFRKSQARVRHGLWLTASIKFLVPFAWLAMLGGALAGTSGPALLKARAYYVVRQIGQPFPQTSQAATHAAQHIIGLPGLLLGIWLCGSVAVLTQWLVRRHRVSLFARRASQLHTGREVDALHRLLRAQAMRNPIILRTSSEFSEPAILGIVRPILLWPSGLSDCLDDAHLDSIVSHELAHVRNHDNLAATVHLVVEALFWFHPLVWWLGNRLLEERERACDEAVLQRGADPRVYAESILEASRFCVQSLPACVSGVTGSDLKQRMVRIMTQTGKMNLGVGSKLMLSTLGVAVIAAPILTGAFSNHRVLAASVTPDSANLAPLETTTIRPSLAAGKDAQGLHFENGNLTFPNVTVRKLIEYAYDLKDYQLTAAPAWVDSERYDVAATWQPSSRPRRAGVVPPPPPPSSKALVKQTLPPLGPFRTVEPGQLQSIVRSVLLTRFGLQVATTAGNLPGYAMEIAPSGSKLPKPVVASRTEGGEQILMARELSKDGKEEIGMVGPLDNFADLVAEKIGSPVVNKTGQLETYDLTLRWTDSGTESGTDSGDKPLIIRTALEQQLGLELVPVSTTVKMLNIEQVKPPSLD